MVESKQSANTKNPPTPKKLDPKTLNTTPKINPDVDYINRTLP
jgi:hypothetical protein